MTKYDQLFENYSKQLQNSTKIISEDFVSDFIRGLTKGEKAQANIGSTPTYRLENPKLNLPKLRQLLKIDTVKEAIITPTEPTEPTLSTSATKDKDIIIFDQNGKIINDQQFSIIFYNAFAESDNGIITLDQLIRQRIGKVLHRDIGETPQIPKDKANKSVQGFINNKGLGNMIKVFDSYEKAQKGGVATRIGTALNTGIKNVAKDIGQTMTTKGVQYI